MRANLTATKLKEFMRDLGSAAEAPGNAYLTGGATALLMGIRAQTLDIDIHFDPEPAGVFSALPRLKNALNVNVELASPKDFIPVTPDWKEKSPFITSAGNLSFYHFDLRAQILSKIERGHAHDLNDAREFMKAGQISPEMLRNYFHSVRPDLVRYPAIDPSTLERQLQQFLDPNDVAG